MNTNNLYLRLSNHSTGTSVFAITVAVALYPSGRTAFVPGIKIHGHTNNAVITAKGVRFLPLVFERLFYPGYVAMAQIRFYGILAFNRKSPFCLSALPPFSTTMS